jgi:hypothetical protein
MSSAERTVAGENLNLIASYSPDIWGRIYSYAIRQDITATDKGVKKEMVTLMVNMGFTSQMPGHGSSKRGKGHKLQPATE